MIVYFFKIRSRRFEDIERWTYKILHLSLLVCDKYQSKSLLINTLFHSNLNNFKHHLNRSVFHHWILHNYGLVEQLSIEINNRRLNSRRHIQMLVDSKDQ